MDESPQIEARCPWCGPVGVDLAALRCGLDPQARSEGMCEFACPVCSRLVLLRVPAAGIATLRRLGSVDAPDTVPLELLERHEGPTIAPDEILELHLALERTCCPQDELTGVPTSDAIAENRSAARAFRRVRVRRPRHRRAG